MSRIRFVFTFAIVAAAILSAGCLEEAALPTPAGDVQKLAGGFSFTEGPAADADGNVYFTDIPNNRIHKWSVDGKLSTYLEDSEGANGLYFDKQGNLLVCQGGGRRLVSIDPKGEQTVLADKYDGKKLNSLNDLWPDGKGGIYFTDPRYGNREGMEQDGEHVYYRKSDGGIIRVVDDMVRPNGIIGHKNGRKIYITDNGAGKTYVYTVNADGTLAEKKLLVEMGADGMTLDEKGNLYLTTDAVVIVDDTGKQLERIETPERPSNVTFGGPDHKMLFITARTSLYRVKMNVRGM